MKNPGYHGAPIPALVLGCPVGPRLTGRVAAAVALWHRGEASALVVSGAGEAGPAARQLKAAGVPEGRIVVEPRACSTWENLLFTRALTGPGELWLVSDAWHLPRAAAMARRLGYAPHPVPVSTGSPSNGLRVWLREAGAWGVAAWKRQV